MQMNGHMTHSQGLSGEKRLNDSTCRAGGGLGEGVPGVVAGGVAGVDMMMRMTAA